MSNPRWVNKVKKSTLPLLKKWELFVSLLPLVLMVLLVVQRNLVYSKGHYGLATDDTLPLFLWALLSLVILLFGKPWLRVSRWGGMFRWCGAFCALWCLCIIFLLASPWGRYQFLRLEALYWNFGITNYDKGLHQDLTSDILDSSTGPFLLEDAPLRRMLVNEAGSTFLRSPQAAAAVLAAEQKAGRTFEDILKRPTGPTFLLACLTNEINPQPWYGLEWLEHQGVSTGPPFHAGLLVKSQAQILIDHFLSELSQADQLVLEHLVFLLMNYPQFFDERARDSQLAHWAKGFTDLESLAVEGLVVRQQLVDFLGPSQSSFSVNVQVSGAGGGEYSHRHLPFVVRQMALGLLRSCALEVTEREGGADLELDIVISEVAHHEYRRPTYDYETYYEYQRTGRSINGYTHIMKKVAKQRRVATGYEDKTAFAPVATVLLRRGKDRLELADGLLFWHHFRYDYENNRFLDLKNESTYGRMWPFGVHQRMFEFPYLDKK